jgi:flagellar biosynthesis/type III secretory pathway protein FliH
MDAALVREVSIALETEVRKATIAYQQAIEQAYEKYRLALERAVEAGFAEGGHEVDSG